MDAKYLYGIIKMLLLYFLQAKFTDITPVWYSL